MLKSRLLGKRDYLLQIVEAGRIPFFNQKFMGREGTAMETKALKKQLGAAIAMVVVAAIALGSATYAWFVSNNSVTANTSSISAKSNSAYLVIANSDKEKTDTDSTSSATDPKNSTAILYPAIWANSFNASGDSSEKIYQFESAYAETKGDEAEKSGTRFAIGNGDAAVAASYATLNTFHIGTGGYDGIFKNLKVTNFTVTAADAGLASAMRVLVTDGSNWVVVRTATDADNGSRSIVESQSLSTATGGVDSGVFHTDAFGKSVNSGDVKGADVDVKCYIYYDGSDGKVYTTNLESLTDCKVTLTFEATPTTYPETAN